MIDFKFNYIKLSNLFNMKRIHTLISTFLILSLTTLAVSQTIFSIDLLENSSLIINGSTNLTTFKLVQNGDKLLRKTQLIKTIQTKNKVHLSENKLSISVNGFTSDNKIALDGFLELLKVDIHPNLIVEFNYLEKIKTEKTKFVNTKTLVSFTITGVTKQYIIPITATLDGNKYTITGNKSINIRDFKLEPPVKMMGLVKVSEWINIDFCLICNISLKEPTDVTANN